MRREEKEKKLRHKNPRRMSSNAKIESKKSMAEVIVSLAAVLPK